MLTAMAKEKQGILYYLGMDDERSFVVKASDQRLSNEERLSYAALIEHKDPERAEWLRLEVSLHTRATQDPAVLHRFIELAREIGSAYVNVFFREALLNCGSEDAKSRGPQVRFAYACPKRWETLAPTEAESVRFCQQCNENVYYCRTTEEASTRVLEGQCIAISKRLPDGSVEGMALGRPNPAKFWAARIFPNK
jgi:hypothetical protein